MRSLGPFVVALGLVACTPIRPLSGDEDAGARRDGGAAPDGGQRDAGIRDDAGAPDGGPPGECAGELGMPCDGPDGDDCEEGVWECADGGLRCTDDTGDDQETCDGTDEDCDGMVDEGPPADAVTWARDADSDGYGDDATSVVACEAPGPDYVTMLGDCDDGDDARSPGLTEACDAVDNDCSGAIDDRGACGPDCHRFTDGGRIYQLCDRSLQWTAARSACRSYGYDLVVIDGNTENAALAGEARSRGGFTSTWWIGLQRASALGMFAWVDGSRLRYTSWELGEPNNGSYAYMTATMGTWAVAGPFTTVRGYICELP